MEFSFLIAEVVAFGEVSQIRLIANILHFLAKRIDRDAFCMRLCR